MLWSQFSAIFDNFRRKNWRFSQKPMLWSIFSKFSFVLSQKRQFFAKIFGENILKIITSVPGHPVCGRKLVEADFESRKNSLLSLRDFLSVVTWRTRTWAKRWITFR
jgi:hypothetical protein